MKLYEIKQGYINFMEAVERGEIPEDAIADTLEGIEGVFEDKADNIACLIKGYLHEADAIKCEIKTLQERMKAKTNIAERMKEYLFSAMQAVYKRKIETSRNRISIMKKPASVVVGDDVELMVWLMENGHEDCVKVEKTLRKAEIGALLKDGAEIPSVEVVSGERIDIK